MSNNTSRTTAAIAAVVLSFALISGAQAKPTDDAQVNTYRTNYAGSAKTPVKLVPAPRSTFTFPEGSPDYHGSNGS